jgi:hypothetical protein
LLQTSRLVERVHLDTTYRSVEALHCRLDFNFVVMLVIMMMVIVLDIKGRTKHA